MKYFSTIGLNVAINNRVKLARVSFTIKDDSVTAQVISGHTLTPLKRLGTITITREAFNALPEDAYDDLVFARAAFGLFGLSVSTTCDDEYAHETLSIRYAPPFKDDELSIKAYAARIEAMLKRKNGN